MYSATWIGGQSVGYQFGEDEGWKKLDPKPMKVALKRLNGSQNISPEYLNEVFFYIMLSINYLNYKMINLLKFLLQINSLKHIGSFI